MSEDDKELIWLLVGNDTTGLGDGIGNLFKKMEAENERLEVV